LWQPAQVGFVLPIAGVYLISAKVQWSASAANNWLNLSNSVSGSYIGILSPSASPVSGQYTDSVHVTAGTLMQVTVNASAAYAAFGNGPANQAHIDYLGTG
jgi:hypothetical protein